MNIVQLYAHKLAQGNISECGGDEQVGYRVSFTITKRVGWSGVGVVITTNRRKARARTTVELSYSPYSLSSVHLNTKPSGYVLKLYNRRLRVVSR